MMNLFFRRCTMEDLPVLQEFSSNCYYETFAHLNTPENMQAYLDEAFAVEKIRAELADEHALFYFLYADDRLAGFLKLNEVPSQTDLNDPDSLEIERIYVSSAFQGQGIGRCLMDKAIDEARRQGKGFVWLGVWEKNEKALAFYRKSGFYEIGTHTFVMGDDAQTDYIMRKDLN